MNIVLLGAPGSGKGLISDFLESNYNLKHISTGNILRENIKNGTPLGVTAKEYMDKGNLVPDELVIDMLKSEITSSDNGIIFDGFPRTLPQAKTLDQICKIDLAISVEVPKEIVLDRMLARRVCEGCGTGYNLKTYSKNTCELCGGKLIKRSDDVPEVIENRINVYNEQTASLKDFYSIQGKLKSVDNSKDAETTLANVKSHISLIK